MNLQKIARRAAWIASSTCIIVPALIIEPRKHPWKYIFDYLTVSAETRYSRTHLYLQKYFSPTPENKKPDNDILVSCGDFSLKIPKKLYDRQTFMLGFLSVYYDVIYPTEVMFPVPVIVEEGSYEVGGANLSKGDWVIDAGANIGVFSLHAAIQIGPTGKVFSFEPIREARDIIDVSASFNKMSSVIKTMPQALGNKTGTIEFKFQIDSAGGSSPVSTGEGVVVPVTTIDTVVASEKIPKIDFIKMDIEGAECDALRGAAETIRRFKPRLAICTYHDPRHPKEIQDIILGIRPDYRYFHTSHKIYAW